MSHPQSYTPAQSSFTRVFLIEGRARPDHTPSYESCLRMMGLSRGFGDIERVECPDPDNYGKFIEVAEIRGASERATTSLEGRYAMDLLSSLLRLANEGCSVDVQLHLGQCTDPGDFTIFEKAIILESAYLTNYSTEDLGSLASGDNAAVNETADISAKNMYEVRPLGFANQATAFVTLEMIDVVICDTLSCGECEDESDGCSRIYALSIAAGGSPTTSADVVFSTDKGVTWGAHDVDTLGIAEDPTGLDCVGSYIVVVSNDSNSLHYALKSEFDSGVDPVFTEVTTGFVVTGEPNAIFSVGRYAFIVGDGGYVYETSDPTGGVAVLDPGSATVDDLFDVFALSSTFAVAVGENGAVIYTEDGSTWAVAPVSPVGFGVTLLCVHMKSQDEWWVGTDGGQAFYTLDQGASWAESTFPGSGAGRVDSIKFATDSIGYLAHATATPRGRILRTFDGGHEWVVLPESDAILPLNDRVNALAVCTDANFVVGAGLADDAVDGYLVLGQAS